MIYILLKRVCEIVNDEDDDEEEENLCVVCSFLCLFIP